MDLLVIRHALPERVERDDGMPADPPLSTLGHRQSRRLAERLAEEPIDHLYVSPMRRAGETVAPFAELSGLAPVVEAGVAEFDRDSDSYVPMEELKATDHDAWLAMVEAGGMPDGGDPVAFQRTVVEAMERIVDAHRGQTVAVVCHGGVINSWAAQVLGLPEPFFFEPRYTSINRFVCSSRGHRSLHSLNELDHLRGLPRAEDHWSPETAGR
ncbi:MAG: histidine phosphatase family protein [Actinomycetota bacterium]